MGYLKTPCKLRKVIRDTEPRINALARAGSNLLDNTGLVNQSE
jgi:hypothetical protein